MTNETIIMISQPIAAAFMFLVSISAVMAQPINYCEGNLINDLDQDGSDAFVSSLISVRSSLLDPCPVIGCETAEQLEIEMSS